MSTPNQINEITEYWTNILNKSWGVEAKLTKLDGEYDLNFLAVSSSRQPLILKVMRNNCPDWLVKAQISALQHVEKVANLPSTPKVFLNQLGQSYIEVADEEGNLRVVWALKYIPGQCLANLHSKPLNLIEEIGEALGATTNVLSSDKNKYRERTFKWNLLQAGWIDDYIICIEDKERYKIVKNMSENFSRC